MVQDNEVIEKQEQVNPGIRRICFVTDTVGDLNGVAFTLEDTRSVLRSWGRDVSVIHPGLFPNIINPVDRLTRLSWVTIKRMREEFLRIKPDAIHIDTEGPVGLAALRTVQALGVPYTTCLHTRWDLYMQTTFFIPIFWTWRYLHWFHKGSSCVFVPSRSMADLVHSHNLRRTAIWSRGADFSLFKPRPQTEVPWPRPMLLYVGRVAKEKNLDSFLSADFPGTAVIVGKGPSLSHYLRRYADKIGKGRIVFLGERRGQDLALIYSNADLFVFPSRSETFGRVLVEALASGVPVASYPAPGPVDVIAHESVGVLDSNLGMAISKALHSCKRDSCVEYARNFSWDVATKQFLSGLVAIQW